MNWDTRRNPIEPIVEWAAPAALATAVGWAAWILIGSVAIASGSLLAVFALGVILLRWVAADAGIRLAAFEPQTLDDAPGEELLLDDPLVALEESSRVVRLFDKQPNTPGEMIARISDFLGERPMSPRVVAAAEGVNRLHHPSDASQALHEALANIRASLR